VALLVKMLFCLRVVVRSGSYRILINLMDPALLYCSMVACVDNNACKLAITHILNYSSNIDANLQQVCPLSLNLNGH